MSIVITRRVGEEIDIGDNIKITVVRIGPETVRLGITAPRDVNIVRSELLRSDAEKQEHASSHDGHGRECGK